MKISVPNFQKYKMITYVLRKFKPSIIMSHVLSHWVQLSFAFNVRSYANAGTEILSPVASNFIKNGSLSPLFF